MTNVRASGFGFLVLAACASSSVDDGEAPDLEVVAKKPPWSGGPGGSSDAGVDSAPIDSAPIDSAPIDSAPIDSAPAPPPPVWQDACSLPGAVVATFKPYGSIGGSDEGATAALALPFGFTYLGRSYTRYWLSSNGELGFGDAPGGIPFGAVKCPLPDAQTAKPIVFAYAADLMGGTVCTAVTGTAPQRTLVVTWKDKKLYELDGSGNGTSNLAFGVTLTEGSNALALAVHEVTVTSPFFPTTDIVNGAWAVLGLQHGSSVKAFTCKEPKAPPGTTFTYQP